MGILVIRPSPAGEELVSRLRTPGQVAWNFPLIEFSPDRELATVASQPSALTENDLIFALSQYAVTSADAELRQREKSWPSLPRYFATDRTTALALHTVGDFNIHYPLGREASEVPLQLPELQNIAGRHAFILRGNGGRELIDGAPTARRADIDFCECYQRSAKRYDGAEEAMRWRSRGVTTMVVTNGETLRQLWSLIPRRYREHWLLRCRLLVVSEHLAHLARELGWQDIKVTDNADNDTLLRVLQ